MRIVSIFISLFLAQAAYSNSFKMNYKNLNAMAELLCQLNRLKTDTKNFTYVNRFNIDQTKTQSLSAEINGVCSAKIKTKTGNIFSSGEPISLQMQKSKHFLATGTVGINTVTLDISKSGHLVVKFKNELLSFHKTYHFKNIKWAQKDSLISLTSDNKVTIKLKNQVMAKEKNSILMFKNTKLYNSWGFNSFSCSPLTVSGKSCHQFADLI